jgi:hypothetical protein
MAHIAAKPVMTIKAILNTGVVSTATPVKSNAACATLFENAITPALTTPTVAINFNFNLSTTELQKSFTLSHLIKLITPFHKVKVKQHI